MAFSFLMKFLDHTQRRTTIGRTPLDEWVARRKDLYLTTHNTHNRQTSMPPVGFEPTISAGERPQNYALDRVTTGTGTEILNLQNIKELYAERCWCISQLENGYKCKVSTEERLINWSWKYQQYFYDSQKVIWPQNYTLQFQERNFTFDILTPVLQYECELWIKGRSWMKIPKIPCAFHKDMLPVLQTAQAYSGLMLAGSSQLNL